MIKNILLLLLLVLGQAAQDHYKVLGLNKNATDDQIRKAFKKLSIKYHPDKNRGNEKKAQDQFSKIVNAYEVLKEPESRQQYDMFGEDGPKMGQGGQGQGGQGGGFHQGGNYEDIFSQFFGGGGRSSSHQNMHFNFGGMGGGMGGGANFNSQEKQQPESQFTGSFVNEVDMGSLSAFLRRKEVWVILFYTKIDKKDVTVWKELAEKYHGIFKVGAVNCSEEEELCQEEFGVQKYPSVLCYPARSEAQPIKYTKKINVQDLSRLAIDQMESFVSIVTSANYDDFVNQDLSKHNVLLFTNKMSTPALLKAVSKELKEKLQFGLVRSTEEDLVKKFNINTFPTLLVITQAFTYQSERFEGKEFDKKSILTFLRQYAYLQPKKSQTKPNFQKLTQSLLKNGHCSLQDSSFCLLYVTKGDFNGNDLNILQDIHDLYLDEPIKIFTVDSQLINLNQSFPHLNRFPSLILLKPKRKRYIIAQQNILIRNELIDQINMILGGGGDYQNQYEPIKFIYEEL